MRPGEFEYRFREPYATPQERGAPDPVQSRRVERGMIIERNVPVALRDGVKILVDIFRPADEQPAPPIIAWTPYGKHQNGSASYSANPGCEVTPDMVSEYATFEGPDPLFWVPHGYALVHADIRGTWYSEGDATFVSPQNAEDFYDLIEWAGTQRWSSGKVGASGVSYLAASQWRVAELRPPHLAAINPWEGRADTYRELARHGGIPDTWFWWNRIIPNWGTGTTRIEDLRRETLEHPLYDAFWESKCAQFEKIVTPAFIVACWGDQGLHARGTLEGFRRISSKEKWLLVHGRKKWAHYYTPENVAQLKDFFDHFLKGESTPVASWPRVRLEVRERYFVGKTRPFSGWPVPETRYQKLFLDAVDGSLRDSPVSRLGSVSYSALGSGPGAHRAQFEFTFREPAALVGHMRLHIVMAADTAEDMDVFVGLYKFDADGKFVPFAFYSFFEDGPVALGWLRASHRELDPQRSTEFLPVLKHSRELKLAPGAKTPLDIEIWPSGTRFAAGERLLLIVQGTDLQKYSKIRDPVYFRHDDTVNVGQHIVYTGQDDASYLQVPLVAAD
jgi:predicted acyl esterase